MRALKCGVNVHPIGEPMPHLVRRILLPAALAALTTLTAFAQSPAPAADSPKAPSHFDAKELDRSVLATERATLSMVAWHWPELDGVEPLDIEIEPWTPEVAARAFLDRYERLSAERDTAPVSDMK